MRFDPAASLETVSGLLERPVSLEDLQSLGGRLCDLLLTGRVRILFDAALGEVLAQEDLTLRLVLRIDPPELSVLPWEILYLAERNRFLSASSKVTLSRTLSLLQPIRSIAVPEEFRALLLVPETSGLATNGEIQELQRQLERVARVEILRPATRKRVRDALRKADVHLVHYAGHGSFQDGQATIYLDSEKGQPDPVPGEAFAELFRDRPSLRLVVLNSCEGASRSSKEALAGAAPQLLQREIPAVIAMQSEVNNSAAEAFTVDFYSELINGQCSGNVEAALSRARGALLQDRFYDPSLVIPAFASPVLYLRAENGELWQGKREDRRSQIEVPGPAHPPIPQAAPFSTNAPMAPEIFVGRTADLDRLKERLGIGKDREQKPEVQVLTAVRGWPGVGKTSIATVLAHDPDVSARFEGVLWASIGQKPDILDAMARWGRWLDRGDLYAAGNMKEALDSLQDSLHQRRMVLVLDDVWEVADVVPFLSVRGPACPLLVTTRETGVAHALATVPESVHVLDVLDEGSALDLLRRLAPNVVEQHLEDCRRLANELGRLPLALHVAGRQLHLESSLGWGVGDLLRELEAGTAILQASAPPDRLEIDTQTLPTVEALFQRSTDRLDPETRERFRCLSGFADSPFGLDLLRHTWSVDDPRPTIRKLRERGLLEPADGGGFQIHSLLLRHAKTMPRVP